MPDTPRTIDDLLTNLFPDGLADNSIAAQQIRDLIVSLLPSVVALYFSTAVETVIGAPNTKVLALGTTTLTSSAHGIDMPQNNRIRYTGVTEKHFIIDVAISTLAAGNNKTIEYQLFKSGIALPETLMSEVHGTGDDHGNIAISTNVHLSPNDYIELFVSNETDATNLTVLNGTMNLLGFEVE